MARHAHRVTLTRFSARQRHKNGSNAVGVAIRRQPIYAWRADAYSWTCIWTWKRQM